MLNGAQIYFAKRELDKWYRLYNSSDKDSDFCYYQGLIAMVKVLGGKVKVGKDGKHFIS